MADKKGEQKIKDVDYASLDDILKEIGEEGIPREKKVYIYRPVVTDENLQRPEIKSKVKDTSKVEKLGDFVPGGTEFDDYSGADEKGDYSEGDKDFSEEIEEELPEGHFRQPIEQDVEDKTVNEILSALDKRIKWEEVRQIDEKPRLEEDYGNDVTKSKIDVKIPELEFKRPIKDKLVGERYNEDLTPKEEEVSVFDKYGDIMNELEDVDIEKKEKKEIVKEEKDAVESVDVVDFDNIDIEEEETEEEKIETNLDLTEEDILEEKNKEAEISDTSFDFDMGDVIEEKEEEEIKFDELDTSVLGSDNNVPIIDTGSFSMGSDNLEFSSENFDEKNKKEESFDNLDIEEESENGLNLDDISLEIPEDIKTDEMESSNLTPEKEVSTFTDSEGFSALDEESSLADLIPDEEGFSPEKESSTTIEDDFESFTKEEKKMPVSKEEKTTDEFGFPDVDEESADEHLDDFSLNANILDEGTKIESDEEVFDGKEFSKNLDSSIPSDSLSYEEDEEMGTSTKETGTSETIELSEEEFELVKKRLEELPEPTASEAKDIIINEKFNKNDMRKFIDILIKNKPYSEVQAFIDKRIGRRKARPKLPVGVYVILSIVLIGVIAYLSILLFTGVDPITSALNGVEAKRKIDEGLRILNTVPGEEGVLKAEKLFEDAIKLNPNDPNYYLDYAEAYLKKNAPKNNELGNEIYTEYAYKKLMGNQTIP